MENVTIVPTAKQIVRDAAWTIKGNGPDPRDDFTQLTFEWVNDGSILDYQAQITCSHNLAWNVDEGDDRVCQPYITWRYRLFQRDPGRGSNWSGVVDDHHSTDPLELVERLIEAIKNRVTKTLEKKEKQRQEQQARDLGDRMVRESVHLLADKLTACRGTQATPIVPGIE